MRYDENWRHVNHRVGKKTRGLFARGRRHHEGAVT